MQDQLDSAIRNEVAMSSKKRLSFVVIGAQKCATSWMYYALREHPQVLVPTKKLEIGYIGGDMFNDKGEEWFFDRFPQSTVPQIGDVSVEYLYDTNSASNLKQFVDPSPRFVVSLRNPVERLISSYYWLVRKGKLENVDITDGIAEVLRQPPGFPHLLEGPIEEVVRRGCYADQLKPFVDEYGAENILVLLYEDVADAPKDTLEKLFRFLRIDASFRPVSMSSRPKRNSYNSFLIGVESSTRNKMVARAANLANQLVAMLFRTGHKMPSQEIERLTELYRPQVDQLELLLQQFPNQNVPNPERLRDAWKLSSS